MKELLKNMASNGKLTTRTVRKGDSMTQQELIKKGTAPIEKAGSLSGAAICYPDPPLPEYTVVENGYIIGTWFCGRPMAKYYGAFPKSFWRRAKHILKPEEGEMLHWFSGTVKSEEGIVTVDGNPEVEPDYLVEGIELPFEDNYFTSSFADPPYSVDDAKRYGFKYPPARSVLRELARVTKPGGLIGLLHEFLPVVKGADCKLIGAIGILNGPQKRIRSLYLFRAG